MPKGCMIDGYPGKCPECKRKVFVVETIDGKTLFDHSGRRHAKTCPVKQKEKKRG